MQEKIIFCLIILLIFYHLFEKKNIEEFKNFYEIEEIRKNNVKKIYNLDTNITLVQNLLYKGLFYIDKIFNQEKIYYTLGFGGLLGIERHQKIIPWDDDLDILILHQDINKIMKLKPIFEKYGLILEKNWKLLKIYFNEEKYPFIDMFILKDDGIRIKRCLTKKKCVTLKNKWFTREYGFPNKWFNKRIRSKINNIETWKPIESIKLLKYWYGNNCLTECKTSVFNHVINRYEKSETIKCNLVN